MGMDAKERAAHATAHLMKAANRRTIEEVLAEELHHAEVAARASTFLEAAKISEEIHGTASLSAKIFRALACQGCGTSSFYPHTRSCMELRGEVGDGR
jgi:hypothetical protein